MQAVGQVVEIGEPGRDTLGDAALRRDRVDLVHRRLEQVFQRHEVFRRAPLGDVVDLGLCAVHHVADIGAVGTGAMNSATGTRLLNATGFRIRTT